VTKIVQPAYHRVFEASEARCELAKLLWHETVTALIDADAVTTINLARADRYVRTRVEFEDIYKIAAEEGPVLKGTEGGEYFNYRWSACEKLNDRLLKLEKAMFGEAVASGSKDKPPTGKAPSDEFLGSNNGLRQ
jgi:hypothetical protein